MTKREAAIVSAYTGYLIGPFDEYHRYVEEKLGRQVQTAELRDPAIEKDIQSAAFGDFITIVVKG